MLTYSVTFRKGSRTVTETIKARHYDNAVSIALEMASLFAGVELYSWQ